MSQKRPETDDTAGEISSKRQRTSLISDDDEEGTKYLIEEKSVVEVMKLLEAEINYSRNHQMKSPSSSSLSSINGCDGESCGPSFSDSSSTVMASFDISNCCSYLVGPTPTSTPALEGSGEDDSSSSSSSSSSPDLGLTGEEKDEINGCDEIDDDDENEDEWLERVLNGTLIEEEFQRSDLSF